MQKGVFEIKYGLATLTPNRARAPLQSMLRSVFGTRYSATIFTTREVWRGVVHRYFFAMNMLEVREL